MPSGTTSQINAFQAFWIKAEDASAAIVLEEQDKTTTSSRLYRPAASIISNLLRISVTQDGYTDESIIRIAENASAYFEKTKDAPKMDQWYVSLSSISEDNISLGINSPVS